MQIDVRIEADRSKAAMVTDEWIAVCLYSPFRRKSLKRREAEKRAEMSGTRSRSSFFRILSSAGRRTH